MLSGHHAQNDFWFLLAPNIAFIKMAAICKGTSRKRIILYAALAVIISDRKRKLVRKRISGQRFQLVSAWGD